MDAKATVLAAMEMLDSVRRGKEKCVEVEMANARARLRTNNPLDRSHAKRSLQRVRLHRAAVLQYDAQYLNLDRVSEQLGTMMVQPAVLNALRAAHQAIGPAVSDARHDRQLDRIETLMESIGTCIDQQQQVSELLSGGGGGIGIGVDADAMSEEDLEAEFAALEAEIQSAERPAAVAAPVAVAVPTAIGSSIVSTVHVPVAMQM